MYSAMHTLKPTSIRIRVGETGPRFLERTGLDNNNNIDRQPAGLNPARKGESIGCYIVWETFSAPRNDNQE